MPPEFCAECGVVSTLLGIREERGSCDYWYVCLGCQGTWVRIVPQEAITRSLPGLSNEPRRMLNGRGVLC